MDLITAVFMGMASCFYLAAGHFAADASWFEGVNYGFAAILTTASLSPWMPRLVPALMVSLNLGLFASTELELGWDSQLGVDPEVHHLLIVGLWSLVLAIVPGVKRRYRARRPAM